MNNLNPIIIKLLENRGIKTQEDILEFLSLNPKRTYDPFLLLNMREAVYKIIDHIDKGSKICIYGDYDADGITSVTMLYETLKSISARVSYYIPSRMEEGYGLNIEAIDLIAKENIDLIITVDCGSVSYDEVEYVKKIGIDIIVTDHHTITDKKSDCILINPKQPGCEYPFKGLAGVGVTFKLVQALTKIGRVEKKIIADVLELAAIGTIGDIMPLVDENRTIVKFGLRELNKGKRLGLVTLLRIAGFKDNIVKSDNVAFIIVPHLNASGRIADASKAVELLLASDYNQANNLAHLLVDCNDTRKKLQEDTYKTALEQLENGVINSKGNIIILPLDDAHEGIIGIVAGKIKDKYNKPTIILVPSGNNGEFLKGTGRSVEGLNLYEILKEAEHSLEKFGGHAGACGFLLRKENYKVFKNCVENALDDVVAKNDDLLNVEKKGEILVSIGEINDELLEQLEFLAPFGNANPKPLFDIDGVEISDLNYLGNEKNHVKFKCVSGINTLGCILFGKAKDYKTMLEGQRDIRLCGSLEFNNWNNSKSIQFVVESMRER